MSRLDGILCDYIGFGNYGRRIVWSEEVSHVMKNINGDVRVFLRAGAGFPLTVSFGGHPHLVCNRLGQPGFWRIKSKVTS